VAIEPGERRAGKVVILTGGAPGIGRAIALTWWTRRRDAAAEIRIRLGRCFEATSHVEEPTTEDAAEAAILGPTEGEIGTAMSAAAIE
jgi:NAD(P)-dependent dehydrogenase (short-subunit alcohol dehydrogenase family)